jgi:hypothetical protein
MHVHLSYYRGVSDILMLILDEVETSAMIPHLLVSNPSSVYPQALPSTDFLSHNARGPLPTA